MTPTFALLDFGAGELILILAILLLLFGGKKLPELSKSIGQSMRELKKGASDATGLRDDIKRHASETKAAFQGKPQSDEKSSSDSRDSNSSRSTENENV